MRERERDRDTGRGRSRLHAGSPMWDSILGLQDHDLSQRQVLNQRATQAPQNICVFVFKILFYLFMRDTERERDRDTGRGRSRLHAGSPT